MTMMSGSRRSVHTPRLTVLVAVVVAALRASTWGGVAAEETDVSTQMPSPLSDNGAVTATGGLADDKPAEPERQDYEDETQGDSSLKSEYETANLDANVKGTPPKTAEREDSNDINENGTNYTNDNVDNNAEESNNNNIDNSNNIEIVDNNVEETNSNKVNDINNDNGENVDNNGEQGTLVNAEQIENNNTENSNNTVLNNATPDVAAPSVEEEEDDEDDDEEKEEDEEDAMNYGGAQWPSHDEKEQQSNTGKTAGNIPTTATPSAESETYEVKYYDSDSSDAKGGALSKAHGFIHSVLDMFWKMLNFMAKGLLPWKLKPEEKNKAEDEKKENKPKPQADIGENVKEAFENVKTGKEETTPETPGSISSDDVNTTSGATAAANEAPIPSYSRKPEERNDELEERKNVEKAEKNEEEEPKEHLHQHGIYHGEEDGAAAVNGGGSPASLPSPSPPYSAEPPQIMMSVPQQQYGLYGLHGLPSPPHHNRYYHGKKASVNSDSSSSEEDDYDEGYFFGAQLTHDDGVPPSLSHSRIELLKTVAMVTLGMAAVISAGVLLSRSRFFASKKNAAAVPPSLALA